MQHKIASDFGAERRLAVTPEIAGWSHLTFRTYGFPHGRPIDGESVDDEVCMMFLAGSATVTVGAQTWSVNRGADVFTGPPQCIYLPPRHSYLLTPLTDCEVAYARWPARGLCAPRFIAPETMAVEERGSGGTAYRVTHVLRAGEAEHLTCAEILIPPGHWYEDTTPEGDSAESVGAVAAGSVWYYRLDPASGWALQRLCADDGALDEALVLRHGDAVIVRDGRHPVVAAPGYRLYGLHIGAVTDEGAREALITV